MTEVAPLSPDQLLAAYQQSASTEIFRQIVDRYVNLVHSAALRQLRHDAHLADDVTQAVFLILSQQARTLHGDTVLAGWFLLTTRNVARNALRREWRLKRRERKAAEMREESIEPADSRAILPVLDEALARLSEPDRSALLLRFFHDKSHREVAAAMGLTEDAATKRVARAIVKLRGILQGLGVTATEGALAAALPMLAGQSAPQALVAAIASGSATPAATALTASGSSGLIGWAIAALVTLAVGSGAYLTVTRLQGPPTATAKDAAPIVVAQAPAAPAPDAQGARTITIRAVDPANSQPIANAAVRIRVGNNSQRTGRTDNDGRLSIGIPTSQNNRDVEIQIQAPGRVPMQMQWTDSRLRGDAPALITVPLETGTTIGGFVCDPSGSPLAGASVRIHVDPGRGHDSLRPDIGSDEIRTDAQGHWQITNAPSKLDQVWVMASHPDFPGSENESMPMVKPEQLYKQTLTSIVRHVATRVSGVVLGPDGKPLPGAEVVVRNDRYDEKSAVTATDAQGKFELAGFPKYTRTVVVRSPGYAPGLLIVRDTETGPPIEIKLIKPTTLEGVVVDPQGKPIARASVELEKWRDSRAVEWKTTTDAQGRFVWREAPADELQLTVFVRGMGRVMGFKVTPGGEPAKIVVYPPVAVSGSVIDAETRQPIPQFTIKHGIRWTGQDDVTWQSMDTRTLTGGRYDATLDNISNGGRLMVEAEGYAPMTSRMIESSEGKITIDFELKKQ
jgi:RNA polymerase sigma factor (sigma-70 family)